MNKISHLKLDDSVTAIPGIGTVRAEALARLEIRTVRDLLYHVPFRYEDHREIISIEKLKELEEGTILVTVIDTKPVYTRTKKFLFRARVQDDSGSIDVVWFNQQYLTKIIKSGQVFVLSGKISKYGNLSNPKYQRIFGHLPKGRLIPIYPETVGVTSKWINARLHTLKPIIENLIVENLPAGILKTEGLISKSEALMKIHFPQSLEDIKHAEKRLAFDEMFEIALLSEKIRRQRSKHVVRPFTFNKQELARFVNQLEFDLTEDQQNTIDEILHDFEQKRPMHRLLNGDVGSGKTIVAIIAMYAIVRAGGSAIMMAPTTILAQQHFDKISQILAPYNIDVELITSSNKDRQYRTDSIKPKVLVGTHALLFQSVLPENTMLVIVDEEHRFGVEQRNHLPKFIKQLNLGKYTAHYLSMTATPIPRTLANILYGDMDISYIKQFPAHRKGVKTYYVPSRKDDDCYTFVRDRLEDDKKEQAFLVFPVIDAENNDTIQSVEKSFEKLSVTAFKDIPSALLHGRMSDMQKQKVLKDFRVGNIRILFSTTVIEVGIDIPNANIMVIDNAERFGLAQLHQLRGRVGRGDKPGLCFVIDRSVGEASAETRLRYFANHKSGFDIAEYDLKSRGPGEVYGLMQSGIPKLKFADIFDLNLLQRARKVVYKMLENENVSRN